MSGFVGSLAELLRLLLIQLFRAEASGIHRPTTAANSPDILTLRKKSTPCPNPCPKNLRPAQTLGLFKQSTLKKIIPPRSDAEHPATSPPPVSTPQLHFLQCPRLS